MRINRDVALNMTTKRRQQQNSVKNAGFLNRLSRRLHTVTTITIFVGMGPHKQRQKKRLMIMITVIAIPMAMGTHMGKATAKASPMRIVMALTRINLISTWVSENLRY